MILPHDYTEITYSERNFTEALYPSQCITLGVYDVLISASDKIKFDPMFKAVSVRILHCKLNIVFSFLNMKYAGRGCKTM